MKGLKNLMEGKNMLLIFLMALVVIVIIDCNTKMFSKLLNKVEGNDPKLANTCGRASSHPQKNPTECASQNCKANGINNINKNSKVANNKDKFPSGYLEHEHLFASATDPLGPVIPRTMQQDYTVLKGFGLVKIPDVINYIPGDGPQQFQKVAPKSPGTAPGKAPGKASKEVHVKMYYAPWCGHSKNAHPEMKKLINKHHGKTMDGVNVKASIVDSEKDKEETKKQGINGFPTFKAHVMEDGKEVTNYVLELPERTLSALENAVKEAVNKIKSM